MKCLSNKLNSFVILLLFAITISFGSCKDDSQAQKENKVLLLLVDRTSMVFEGGKEFIFPKSNDFTISTEYIDNGDFTYIKFYYEELNELIFDASMVFSGTGSISFPMDINSAESFDFTDTSTLPVSKPIFKFIKFNGEIEDFTGNLTSTWDAVKNLQLVNEYIKSNPNGKAYFFFYLAGTPGREGSHKHILIFKN